MNKRIVVRCLIVLLVLGIASLLFPFASWAADYPDRPIEIIAPFGAGSSTDRMTLAIIPFLEKELKQKVLPSYRSGGGGTIGTAWLAKAKPDGYNLAIVPTGVMIVKPLTSNLPYALKDFVPVAQVGIYQTVLIVREDSHWKTLPDFIEEAKKNPEKFTFGSSGPFSMGHIAMEAVKQATGIQVKHVPFEGAGKLSLALLGKQVDVVVTEIRPEYGRDGKTRILTAVTDRRLPDHPQVPTFKELGYDLVMDVWYCLVAPKGTPQPTVMKLEGVLQKASVNAEFKEMFQKTTGAPMEFLPGKAVSEKWGRDLEVIGRVVKTLGVEKK